MIRDFKNSDIDAIMQIWLEENIKAHSFISNGYWERNYDYVKSVLPNSEIYVYINNNEIAGFIGLNHSYIEGVFVKSGNQHQGIGATLLNKAKEKTNELTLLVYKKNIQAINFYRKNEFKIIKESIESETRETEYTMMWRNGYDNINHRCNTHGKNEFSTEIAGKI